MTDIISLPKPLPACGTLHRWEWEEISGLSARNETETGADPLHMPVCVANERQPSLVGPRHVRAQECHWQWWCHRRLDGRHPRPGLDDRLVQYLQALVLLREGDGRSGIGVAARILGHLV